MIHKSRTISIVLGIVAIGAVCSYIFLILRIRSKVGELSALEAQAQGEQVYASDNHALNELVADTASDINSLSTHFLSSDGTVAFIESVEASAKSKGLNVVVSSITSSDAGTEGFSLVNVTLSTSGSWSATYAFLKSLENMPYQINVTSVSLNQDSGPLEAGQAKAPASNSSIWSGAFAFTVLQQK